MSLPRLVATDLDGTLLRSDGTVSDRTAATIRRLLGREVQVVFVTARPLRWMDDLWRHLDGRGIAVVSNGAITYDIGHDEVLALHGIEREAGLALTDAIRSAVPGTAFALECLSGFRREPGYVDQHGAPPGTPVGALGELWDEPAVKVLAQHRTLAPQEFRDRVIEAVGDRATPTWTIDGLMEISATDVTKGGALAEVCTRLGVDASEVVAFGDMPNDVPMLRWAGTSYAMANAHPDVVAEADHIAPTNDEDGVAVVLTGLFGA
jgi:Cof subfamily protein (haloacid dehalogenase superfamily)